MELRVAGHEKVINMEAEDTADMFVEGRTAVHWIHKVLHCFLKLGHIKTPSTGTLTRTASRL